MKIASKHQAIRRENQNEQKYHEHILFKILQIDSDIKFFIFLNKLSDFNKHVKKKKILFLLLNLYHERRLFYNRIETSGNQKTLYQENPKWAKIS